MKKDQTFRIEWDLREFGERPAPVAAPAAPTATAAPARPDFSRFDLARAVAAGYVPANERRFDEHEAA